MKETGKTASRVVSQNVIGVRSVVIVAIIIHAKDSMFGFQPVLVSVDSVFVVWMQPQKAYENVLATRMPIMN